MTLYITNGRLVIELSWLERALACSWRSMLDVAIANVVATSTLPRSTTFGLRAPGTHIPGIVKMGSFYTIDGWEFWCWVRGRPTLTVSLRDEPFRRIILATQEASRW